MNLSTVSTGLYEIVRGESRFPASLRDIICEAVGQIRVDELDDLLSKHEADSTNFDARIESNLRALLGEANITANCRMNPSTRFNCDLVIETTEAVVCVEIEKGNLARFELDILKMLSFGFHQRGKFAGKSVFGCFIVPADNIVARHISGNSRESSFKYVTRFFRLVAEVGPMFLNDILLIGYSASEPPQEEPTRIKTTPRPPSKEDSIVREPSDDLLSTELQGYDALKSLMELLRQLKASVPELRVKYNRRGKYLGFAAGKESDAAYVHIQKRGLVVDVRVSVERGEDLKRQGFRITPRNSYQGRAGWLTGVRVPTDTRELAPILEVVKEALGPD